MPNVKFGLGDKSGAKKEASGIYDGPLPPKGVYHVLVRRLQLKINRNGDPMLNCLVEIKEPKGKDKSKFNGYGFWWNGNVTDDGAGYVNQFLDAISGENAAVRKAFWNGKVRTSAAPKKGAPASVLAIGPLKIQAEGMPAVVSAYRGPKFQDEVNLKVGDWLLPSAAIPDDSDVEEPDDDDDVEVDTEVVDAEIVDDDDDAGDDAGDDDDDDDGGIEVEPSDEDDDDEPPF